VFSYNRNHTIILMYRKRRFLIVLIVAISILAAGFLQNGVSLPATQTKESQPAVIPPSGQQLATSELELLAVKGRAPKTGYSREQFGSGWRQNGECDTRNDILARDLKNTVIQNCLIQSGTLDDPYTGKIIQFTRGSSTSSDVQIDHVVALSDAWQKGAQNLDPLTRENLANDPLELLAVDGSANQNKSDGDAATWLPPNKPYRCRYIARQIAVKKKYSLWVTLAEKNAMENILESCPGQVLPVQS
jgi:uncharacterized protein DUF1524